MSSLNRVTLIGNLGADPEIRKTQDGTQVANFSIATTDKYKNKNNEFVENTEWHKIVAWGRLAEICQEYVTKGSRLYIEGSLKTNEWEDKDGKKRYTTEITAFKLLMLDGKPQDNEKAPGPARSTPQPTAEIDDGFEDMDDSLPF